MNTKKVGMFGGKFHLHNGHIYSLMKSAEMVDHLYVVVSYIEDRDKELYASANLPYADYKQRALWLTQITKDMPNITVLAVEDIKISENGLEYAWVEGAKRIKKAIPEKITHVFSSEPEYEPYFKLAYGEDIIHVVTDEGKNTIPISATKIRELGIYNCWEHIPDVCKPFFTKKIAIVGVESTGKSTLTKLLAEYFNTNLVEEYGRIISEEYGNGSNFLSVENYKEIVYGHKHLENIAVKTANKALFVDSEAVVTQYYAKMYLGQEYNFIENVIQNNNYDLYIYLEPDVKWVADGFRTFNDNTVRQETNEILKGMFKKRNIEFVSVNGNYEERFKKSVDIINKFLNLNHVNV